MKSILPLLFVILFRRKECAALSSTIRATETQNSKGDEVKTIQKKKEQEARDKHNNDVFNALFVSVDEKCEASPILNESGKRPSDFPGGAFLRLGPNGASREEGFLDGDGLLHCVTISEEFDDTPLYSSAYIDTNGRKLEKEKNKKFIGSLGSAPEGLPLLASVVKNLINFQVGTKDTCNTALAESGGKVLALMEQAPPTEIEISKQGIIKTIKSKTSLNNSIPYDVVTGGSFSAHGRTCPKTGDRYHVSYQSASKPYARVDVFNKGWNLKQSIGVNLKAPAMIHDCAITDKYVVVLDFPLTVRPIRMFGNRFPVEYEPENGARIGLVAKDATSSEKVTWFECEPGVILHTINAFEKEDGTVILHALRSEPTGEASYITAYTTAFLYEWVLDVKSGKIVSEQCLNAEELVEFPIVDERLNSIPVDHCYAVGVSSIGGPLKVYNAPREGILLDRVVKFALDNHATTEKGSVISRFVVPEGYYLVTEPCIVPKIDGSEGDVYVIVGATRVPNETPDESSIAHKNVLSSRVFVLDGDDLDAGPAWEFDLPYHLPYGLHSTFLSWDKLK